MNVLRTTTELLEWRRSTRGTVGFAPTMGNLHAGHLACLAAARRRTDHGVVSIFVNPAQFGPTEDFAQYPRTLDRDLTLLEASGCDAAFVPSAEDIYPSGCTTRVRAGSRANPLEGAFRPGHFDGVATVCLKLFHLVRPDVAAFGCKDLQQLRVIEQMVADLNVPVAIEAVPTVREHDGVALSSRNQYLSASGRAQARQLHDALLGGWERIARGENPSEVEHAASRTLAQAGWDVDYVAVRDAETLEIPTPMSTQIAVLGAARWEGTRLIDNVVASVGRP